MTRRPFDPDELGGVEPELGRVAGELESYGRLTAGETPHHLSNRVMDAIAAEPAPRRGMLAGLLAPLTAWPRSNAVRAVLVAGTMILAVGAVVIAGQLAQLFEPSQVGPSPAPSQVESTTATPSPTAEESVTPSPSVTPTPSPTQTPRPPSPTPRPTETETETPEPGTVEPTGSPDEEESETPDASEDNSGPGGGGSD